jgi:uncharacterized iron-regulated membrane protein
MKRLLFTAHRWLGIALGLFMLLWFASGLAMLYAGPSMLPAEERLAHADALHAEPGWLSLGEAWTASAAQRAAAGHAGHAHHAMAEKSGGHASRRPAGEAGIGEARLVSQASEPVWLVDDERGVRYALSALDGGLRQTGPERAVAIARAWSGGDTRFVETFDSDRGTRMSHFDLYRPFHRIALDDAAGTELLVSARTGEVVRAATATDRALRLAGGWLHFFRPLDDLGLSASRKDVLTWTALAGVVAALTGLVVGWLRLRPGARRYSGGRVHPYRAAWARWHFWLGLSGGLFALGWLASGFLANNPWALFSRAQASGEELRAYRDGAPPTALLAVRPARLLAAAPTQVVELSLHHVGGNAVVISHSRDGARHALGSAAGFAETTLVEAAHRVVPGAAVRTQRWLHDYDAYYYPSRRQGAAERPLPVLEVELDDAAATRVYIDPADGALVARLDRSRRVYRWLFNALHNWDFPGLRLRPVWDVWMVGWSLAGLALSLTSLVIAWRRLTRKQSQPRQAPRGAINLHEIEEGCAS